MDIPPAPGPIIVIGVERSGTSVVAEMVHRWGAYAGDPQRLHQADVHAPRGYWEYLPLWDLLEELGEFASGATWWDGDFQQRMKDKASEPEYRAKALGLISTMRETGQPWFWKDPALAHFLPFWQVFWSNPTYVVTIRNPRDTAVSWQKFIMPKKLDGHVSFVAMNLLRWQHMMMQILEHTEGAERRLFVAYEDVVRSPIEQAERLCGFLDSRYGRQVSLVHEMASVVDGRLWRNDCGIPFDQCVEATAEQKALYTFTRRKVDDPLEPYDPGEFPPPPGYLEFLNIQEALLRAHGGHEESANA